MKNIFLWIDEVFQLSENGYHIYQHAGLAHNQKLKHVNFLTQTFADLHMMCVFLNITMLDSSCLSGFRKCRPTGVTSTNMRI